MKAEKLTARTCCDGMDDDAANSLRMATSTGAPLSKGNHQWMRLVELGALEPNDSGGGWATPLGHEALRLWDAEEPKRRAERDRADEAAARELQRIHEADARPAHGKDGLRVADADEADTKPRAPLPTRDRG